MRVKFAEGQTPSCLEKCIPCSKCVATQSSLIFFKFACYRLAAAGSAGVTTSGSSSPFCFFFWKVRPKMVPDAPGCFTSLAACLFAILCFELFK